MPAAWCTLPHMEGSEDPLRSDPEIEDVTDDAIEEVEGDRKSILAAASNARSIAMLTGTHGVVAPPLERPRLRLPLAREIAPEGAALEQHEGDDDLAERLRA